MSERAGDGGRRLDAWPSTRGVRRRVILALELTLVAGILVPLLISMVFGWYERLAGATCGLLDPSTTSICRPQIRHPELRYWLFLIPLALLLAALLLIVAMAARWCLAPLRRMVEPLAAVGPQNLGYRVADAEPELVEDPDLAALAQAVDTMMQRIALGYEGQRRFAANASHELRTPLAVQRALIEVGLAEDVTPDQLQLLTRQLLAANERNERLIEGLLVLAETDQGLDSRTPQRLDEIAAGVVAVHGSTAAGASVELVTELVPVTVTGERVLLERLVTNLVQNAIKYNRPGGRVLVRVAAEEGFGVAVLSVANTGDRVPGEAVAGLFEPFRRLRGERIDHSGGAGLGLTIARSIVAAHGGAVSAEANQDDGGLTLRVRLPLMGARSPGGTPAQGPARIQRT